MARGQGGGGIGLGTVGPVMKIPGQPTCEVLLSEVALRGR